MTITIIVATHKVYEMPEDRMYLPVFVGATGKADIGYQRDDEGENISLLNPYYCELTGMYWAWKNLKSDYIGLVHYRRLFTMGGHILTESDITPCLGKIKIFIPRKRKYYIETLKTHYEHTHYSEHLTVTKGIIEKRYPEYQSAYDKAVNRCWGYMFNMVIMHKEFLDDYCEWLFNILADVFSQIDTSSYSSFEKRYIGRISELLFNVWLEKKRSDSEIKKGEIKELRYTVEENWLVKIPAFLKAKFQGRKYQKSF